MELDIKVYTGMRFEHRDGRKYIIDSIDTQTGDLSIRDKDGSVQPGFTVLEAYKLFKEGTWLPLSTEVLIGWRIVKAFPGMPLDVEVGKPREKGIHFAVGTMLEQRYKPDDSPDYFEPVYETETYEEIIEIGTPLKKVRVTSRGVIQVLDLPGKKAQVSITEITRLRNWMRTTREDMIPWEVEINTISIGCVGEDTANLGTVVTVNDINEIINTYDKLNPRRL